LQSNWGDGINDRVGSLADVNDDADGDLGLHVAQLWYRHRLLDRRLALAVGFLDFQTIVDRNAFANSEDKQFWNQALDNNPLIPLGIGLGAWLEIQPTNWWTVNLGAVDAQSVLYKPGFSTAFHDEDWFLAYAESTLKTQITSDHGPLAGNYRTGVVYDPRPRDEFREGDRPVQTEGDNHGWYISADQKVFRENDKDDQGLGVFGRFGYRTPETYKINRFWSAGLSYTGLIPTRDADVLGFGFALQRPSGVYRSRVDSELDNETAYELYYAIQLNQWLVVTPDVQYVENPGGADDVKPAVVAGVRVRASF
jgi:porin